ncbi:hypothetical protein AKO1_008920 [Acrasis kona]|uniref:Uncharacterized protein n=1 Tax=Acrasis kona TaxID=1008807 RepID=A0AAW2ZFV4_9EUKA
MAEFYTSVGTYWWLFLVVFAVITSFCFFACIIEACRKTEETLNRNPIIVFIRAMLLLTFFYGAFAFVTFSIDTLFRETFTFTQLFNSNECTFYTNRGIMTTISLIFSILSTCCVMLTITDEHNMVRDYAFTMVFMHFCIVSLVMLDFPLSWAWWIAIGVGVVSLDLTCEATLYQLNTMPYKSHMAGDQKRKKVKKSVVGTPRPSQATIMSQNNIPKNLEIVVDGGMQNGELEEKKVKRKKTPSSDGRVSPQPLGWGNSTHQRDASRELDDVNVLVDDVALSPSKKMHQPSITITHRSDGNANFTDENTLSPHRLEGFEELSI